MRRWLGFALLCLFVSLASAQDLSETFEIILATGPMGGAFDFLGKDIRTLAAKYGITVHLSPSDGATANAWTVYRDSGVHIGLTHGDVLRFIQIVSNEQRFPKVPSHIRQHLEKMREKISLIAPLDNSEVHLLTKESIKNFEALRNKKISVGPEESGTHITARFLLALADMNVEMLHMPFAASLDKLCNGEIDAMFFVARSPIPLFKKSKCVAEKKLHLIDIEESSIGKLSENYKIASIKERTYSWQLKNVMTISTTNILISLDSLVDDCKKMTYLLKIIRENLPSLKKSGLARDGWQAVDLHPSAFDSSLKGWKQSTCLTEALKDSRPVSVKIRKEPNPIIEALKSLPKAR